MGEFFTKSAIFCALFLMAFDVLSQSSRPVAPGQEFNSGYINVRAPNSGGWQLVSSSSSGMGFAKPGKSRGETMGAQVLMFGLEPTQTAEQFLALIQSGTASDTDPNRFDVLKKKLDYSSERGYPCVRLSTSVRDKEAKTSPTTREVLLLEAEALYCRHPVRDTTGFAILYSYRGRESYLPLKDEADDFIKSIQVPGDSR
jgi:hypothetical protein